MSHCQHHNLLPFCNCGQHARLTSDTETTPELQHDQTQGIRAVQVRQVFAWDNNHQQIFDASCAQRWTPFAHATLLLDTYWAQM